MVKIWYSVGGEGMGHAVRSDGVLEGLVSKHNVMITAADKAYPYLAKKYKHVDYIVGNRLVYINNKMNNALSALKFWVEMPLKVLINTTRILPKVIKFKPDVIISDFESASHYFAKILKVPCISIDNISCQTQCKIDMPEKPRWFLGATIRFLHPESDYYIIPAFADMIPNNPKKTKLVNPIVRNAVREVKSEDKGFVLVYQTSPTNKKMIPILKKTGKKFKIYGMNEKSSENLEFKGFSEKGFLEDFRTCSYVIINGGFTALSEALSLKKPILAIPIDAQYEQCYNGYSIKKKGLGSYTKELRMKDIVDFEKNLEKYKKNLSKLPKYDGKDLYNEIDRIISICMKKNNLYFVNKEKTYSDYIK